MARSSGLRVTDLDADDAFHDIGVEGDDEGSRPMHSRGDGTQVRLLAPDADVLDGLRRFEVVVDGWRFRLRVEDAQRARLRARAGAAKRHAPDTPRSVRAQLPGRVVSVAVAAGDQVILGQRLLAVEAMKMENEVRAPRAGVVESVTVAAGDRVEQGDELVRIA